MKHQIIKLLSIQALILGLVVTMAVLSRPGIAGTSVSNPVKAITLEHLFSTADFVFRGAVEDIQFVTSEPTGPNNTEVPYTFVTYRITRLFKGDLDNSSITLRFVGGTRLSDGVTLKVTHVPTFDIYDEDILFVTKNNVAKSPLAHWQLGRLRIIDGHLYDNERREILMSSRGEIQLGKPHHFKEVTSPVTNDFSYDDQDLASNSEISENVAVNKAIAIENFLPALDKQVLKAIDSQSGSVAVPIMNADPSIPFKAFLPKPIAPPSVENSP